MEIEAWEAFDSGLLDDTLTASSYDLKYWARGTNDPFAARDKALQIAPSEFGDKPLARVRTEPVGYQLYSVEINYGDGSQEAAEQTGLQFSFDTTGGTQKVTQSFHTEVYALESEVAPDFSGAIGVTKDNVEGVDIVLPTMKRTFTKTVPKAMVTDAYINALYAITGKTNSVAMFGAKPGEVLFMGATGQGDGIKDPQISFTFELSPNASNLAVGGISGIAKKGWEYLWTYYESQEDQAASHLVQRPKAVYVEQVYQATDLRGLI